MPDESIHKSVKNYVNQYVHDVLNDFRDKTPRFRYLFSRLIKNVTAIVMDMAEELRVSEFRPMKFELEFSERGELPPVALITEDGEIKISGFVDRVDGWENNGRLYLRVVDYKTGRKSFDFTDILHGIGLQMLIYLFALERSGEGYFHKPIVPSGVLYIPARDVLVQGSRSMDEKERLKKVSYELRRKGVILDDEAVLNAMEDSSGGEIHYLPVKLDLSLIHILIKR